MRPTRRNWRGMGQLEGCVPKGTQVIWTGNLNAKPYGDSPPLAHVLDDCSYGGKWNQCSLKSWLASRHFELIGIEWVSGWLNPWVNVRANANEFFNSKDEAANYFTDALNGIADAQMADFRIEVRPQPCPSPEPAPIVVQQCSAGQIFVIGKDGKGSCQPASSFNLACPSSGEEIASLDLRTGEIQCRAKRKARGSSFIDGDGWSFDPFDFQTYYTAPYAPTTPAPSYAQTTTPMPQTQSAPSDGGKTETPSWLWLVIIGVGIFVFTQD